MGGQILLRHRLELGAEGEALHRELESVEVRRDSDRIARELHDGLGADLVALNLSLRNKGAEAREPQRQVLAILEELRSVVWSLRGGHGSLAEFEKVVCSRVRASLPEATVESSASTSERLSFVDPERAFAVLGALHACVRELARLRAVSHLSLELCAEPRLQLVLRIPEARDALPGLVVTLRDSELARASAEVLADGSGLRIAAGE